jgi:hypothetical protein
MATTRLKASWMKKKIILKNVWKIWEKITRRQDRNCQTISNAVHFKVRPIAKYHAQADVRFGVLEKIEVMSALYRSSQE